MEAWDYVSQFGHRKDALCERKEEIWVKTWLPERKIETKVLQSMMKEAYKDELDQLIRKVPSLTEADDKTAEKEVEIVSKEVVDGAPPLTKTGAALDAEPESNEYSTELLQNLYKCR